MMKTLNSNNLNYIGGGGFIRDLGGIPNSRFGVP